VTVWELLGIKKMVLENFTSPVMKLKSAHINSKPANKLIKAFFKKQRAKDTHSKKFLMTAPELLLNTYIQ